MANAEIYKDSNAPFFPLQGPRVQRGADVRIPTDAANVEYPPISKRLTQSDEEAVWSQYEAMPPSADAMEKASNTQSSRRWIIPGVVAASFIVGIAYAAFTDSTSQIREPAVAANEASATDASATALMSGAPLAADPNVADPTITPQSAFDASQPVAASATPPSSAPKLATPNNAGASNAAVKRTAQPAAKPVTATPPIAAAEPAIPAPTYSRGETPANSAPAPIPDSGTLTAPAPLPGALEEEPAMKMDLAPPSETAPAPGSIPENAQTPQ